MGDVQGLELLPRLASIHSAGPCRIPQRLIGHHRPSLGSPAPCKIRDRLNLPGGASERLLLPGGATAGRTVRVGCSLAASGRMGHMTNH